MAPLDFLRQNELDYVLNLQLIQRAPEASVPWELRLALLDAEVGEEAATLGIDQLITIGEMGGIMARAAEKAGLAKSTTVGSTTEAAHLLGELAAPGDLVLVKGSRLARTERVLEKFAKDQSVEGVRK